MWHSYTVLIKLSLQHKQDDSELRRFVINLKNVGTTFFKITQCHPFQSCLVLSIHVSLAFCCISFIFFNSFKDGAY